MKFSILLMLTLVSFFSLGQEENEIIQLEEKKRELKTQINEIQEELKLIDEKIKGIINYSLSSNNEVLTISKITLNATLRRNPKPEKDYILKIRKGQNVEVLEIVNDYYKIRYNGKIGYINNVYLFDPVLVKIAETKKKQKAERAKEEVKLQKERNEIANAQRLQEMIEKYGEIDAKSIANGIICIGMTESMVKLSIGNPNDINRTTGSWGVHEQWIYKKGRYKYVYIENGKLTSFSN